MSENIRLANRDGEWVAVDEDGEAIPAPFRSLSPRRLNNVYHVAAEDGYGELQRALDELGDDPGAVVVGAGEIDDVDDNVSVPANTWLRGGGMFATRLVFADETELDQAGLIRVEGDNVVVSDMELDGNRDAVGNTGSEYGTFSKATTNLLFDRLYVHDFPGYGFDPHRDGSTSAENLVISDSIATRNGIDGITVAGVENATVTNCVSFDNDRHGINLTDAEGDYNAVTGCHAYGNGDCGLAIQNAVNRTTVIGGSFRGNGTGIRIGAGGGGVETFGVSDAVIESNASYGLKIRGSSRISISQVAFRENCTDGDANADVSIQGTDGGSSARISVVGCHFDSDTTYGVDERPDNGPTTVVGCTAGPDYSTPVNLTHEDSEDTANLT